MTVKRLFPVSEEEETPKIERCFLSCLRGYVFRFMRDYFVFVFLIAVSESLCGRALALIKCVFLLLRMKKSLSRYLISNELQKSNRPFSDPGHKQ